MTAQYFACTLIKVWCIFQSAPHLLALLLSLCYITTGSQSTYTHCTHNYERTSLLFPSLEHIHFKIFVLEMETQQALGEEDLLHLWI